MTKIITLTFEDKEWDLIEQALAGDTLEKWVTELAEALLDENEEVHL